MASVRLVNVSKVYGSRVALQDISFDCADGEFLAILGSAGSGKTSLLKVISGLESVSSGEVYIGDRLVNEMPPEARDTAMVFETYFLYPHFSVFDNMAFPLHAPGRQPRLSNDQIEKRVRSIANVLQIEDLLDRRPWQLSGGQRQRIALGRALVREPKVFLMDEPISHLDAKLRNYMRGELKRVQRDIGITTIYATPDYTEAMAMADHVLFLHEGAIHQFGTPSEIFDRPASLLVAKMVGDPAMNLLEARVDQVNEHFSLVTEAFALDAPPLLTPVLRNLEGQDKVIVGVRPTDLFPSLEPRDDYPIEGSVHVFEPLGPSTVLTVRVGPAMISVKVAGEFPVDFDDRVWLGVRMENLHLFHAQTGRRLRPPSGEQRKEES